MLPTYRPGDPFGLPSLDGKLRLRREDADGLNVIKEEIRRLRKLTATPPLYLSDEPSGRNLSLKGPGGFYALLSGSSSPYSFTEQVGGTGGAWVAAVGGNSGTTNAYEVNGVSGLAGNVVWLEPGYPGDYRFQWVSFGTPGITLCGCANVPTTLYFTGTYLLADGVTRAPISYPLVYSTTPITIYNSLGAVATLTQYWDSGCIALPGAYGCTAYGGTGCYARNIWGCDGFGHWNTAGQNFAYGDSTCSGAAPHLFNNNWFSSLWTGTCSPYAWSQGSGGSLQTITS